MKRFRIRLAIVAAIAGLFATVAPAPAMAAHNCSLDDVSGVADTACENYHNPKGLIGLVVYCVVYAQNFCLDPID